MKRFSTILSKVKILMLLCIMLSTFISAYADEYKSMIRYDRVWECVSYENGRDIIKCMRFDGTEEINGKVYHRLVTFKKIWLKFDIETQTNTFGLWENGLSEHEGYLREEDGVVYTLLVCDEESSLKNDYWGALYIPEKYEPKENQVIVELPLYNFNCNINESYDGLTFCDENGYMHDFTVKSKDIIEIEGEDCRIIQVYPNDENYEIGPFPFIEGIGAVNDGCLNYHEYYVKSSGMSYHNCFTRLFDIKGNVIYPFDSESELQYGSFEDELNGISYIEERKNQTQIYDLLGRRLTTPSPGQLYIQDGKKLIAPKP